ncbi:MAG: hypothetical protein Tsb0016_02660 [Sphingomonadales bacterium]
MAAASAATSPGAAMAEPVALDPDDLTQACTAINHDYAIARDRGDAEAFAPLFTEDARFTIQGEVFAGRDAILERLRPGVAANFARLLIHTVQITPQSDGTATGVTYFTMFMAADGGTPTPPIKQYMLFMGEYHDRYIYDGAHCRFQSRQTVPLFSGAVE